MKPKNFKRSIYMRTVAGFLLIWMAMAGTFSAYQLIQTRSRIRADLQMQVQNAARSLIESAQREPNSIQRKESDLWQKTDSMVQIYRYLRYVALFDASETLLSASGDPVLSCSGSPYGDTAQRDYLVCDLTYISEADRKTIQSYLTAPTVSIPDAVKGDISGYNLIVSSGWVDGHVLIPKYVMIQEELYDTVFSDSSASLTTGKIVETRSVAPDAISDFPVYDGPARFITTGDLVRHNGTALYAAARNQTLYDLARSGNALDGYRASYRNRIMGDADSLYVQKPSFLHEFYYAAVPDQETWNFPEGSSIPEYQNYCAVFTGESYPLREALPTLLTVCVSSLLMFLCAALLVAHSLCKTYAREQALAQTRRETANALAHDLKTPMSLIRGYAENLLCGVGGDKQTQYLTHIVEESDRMNGMLTTMLDFARLERDDLPFSPSPVALDALAAAVAARYRTLCADHGLSLTVDAAGTLTGDAALLHRALDNLLANAVRHTSPGGAVVLTARPNLLTVRNTGNPIPDDVLPRIWEPYFRGDAARSADRHTGLGLAIVAAVGRRHGLQPYAENTADGVIVGLRKR